MKNGRGTERRTRPSEVFKRFFSGPEHRSRLAAAPPAMDTGPVVFADEEEV